MPDLSKVYKGLQRDAPGYLKDTEEQFVNKWKGKEDKLHDTLSKDVSGFKENVPKDAWYKQAAETKFAGTLVQDISKGNTSDGNAPKTKKATPATHNVVNNAPEPPSFNTDDVVKSSYDIHNEQDNKAPITIKNKFGKDVNKTDIVTAGPKAILENIDNPIDAGKLMAEATNTQVDPAGAIDMWKGMLSDTYDESKKALDTKFGEGTFSTYQDMNKELQDRIESGDKSAEEEYKVFQENSKPLTDSNEFKNFQDISDKVNNAPIQEKLVSTDALSNQFSDVNNLRGNVLNPDSSESKQSTDFVNKGLVDPTKDPLDVGAKLTGTFGLNQLVDDASSDYRSYNMRSNNEAAINAYRQSVQQSLSQLTAETDKVFGAGATDGYLTSKTVREKGLRSLAEKTKTDPTFIPQFTKLYKEYKEFLDKNKDLSESNSFMAMSAYNDGLSKAQKYEDNLDKVFPNSNTYSDWKNNIQAEADKRYAKDYTPVVGASNSLNNYAGRTILRTVASTIESIGALTHSDKLMETAADIKNSVPEASFFNRSGYEHIAKVKEEDFDGNKVTNTYAVDPKTRKAMYGIDKDGNMIPLMQEKNIDKSVELKSEVNPTVYINQAAQVVSDMIPLVALTTATGGITSAALAAGVEGLAGAELASYTASAASKIRWATTTAEFVGAGLQQQPQALQRSLQEGANMDQAYLAQIISGILYGSVSLINPMEAKYAQKLLGAGEGAYSAKLIDKIINGKLTIPQALKHIAKDVSFNIAKENLEETLLEPLSDEVASKAQTLITGQKYQNQLPTLQQTIDTGIITALSTAFFSGVSGDMSRSSIMKNAINTMVADPKEYIKKLELLKQADPANFSDLSESLVKVLGQVEDAGISPKNKQDLALLLIEKAKLVHAQNKADAKGNADILRAQTSDKISELDSAIDKVIELDKKEKESGKKQPGPEKVIVPQEPEVVTPDAKTASTDNPTVDESTSKNNTAVTTPTLSEDGNTLTVPGKNSPQVYTKVEGIWNIETENGSIPMDDNLVSKFITPNLDLAQHPDVSKVETATPSVEDSKKIYTEAVSTQADHLNDEYGVKNDKSTPIITAIGDAIDNGDTSVDELMGVLGKAEAVEEDNDTDTRKARMEILQDGILSIPLQSDVKAVVAKLLKDDKTGSNVIEYLKNILGFHKDNSNHRSIAYGQVESTPASELSKIDKKIRDVKAKKTESEKKLKERQNQKSQTKTVKSAILALEAEIKGHDENLSKLERTKTKFIVDNKLSNSTPSETSDTLDVDKRIGGVQEALSKVNKDLKALRQGKDTETYDAKSLGKKEEPLLNKIADLKAQLKELNDEKKAILNGESTDSTTGNISENVKSSKDEKSSKEKGKKSGTTTNAANDEKGGQSEGLLNENGKAGDSTSATPNTESTTKADTKVSPIDFLPIKKYPKEGDNIVITSPVSKKKITAVFQDGKWWQQTASNNRIVLNDSLTILAQTTFEGGEKQSKAFSQEEHDRLKEVRPEDAKPVSEETKNDKEAIKDSKFKFNKGFSVVYYGQEYHYMGTEITKDGRVYHRFKGPVLAINLFEDSHADILTNISEGKIKASASSDVHTLIDRANEATSANKEYLTENEVNDRASTLQDPKKLSRWNRFWAERRVKAFANKLKKSFPNIEVIFDKKIAEDVYNEHLTQPLRDAEALLTKVNDKLSSYGTIPDAPTKYKNGRVSKQAQQDFDYLTQSHKALTNQKVKLEEQIASLKDTYNTNIGEKKYFRTVTGNVYGYALGNKVYLDPSILSSETAIHEFGHIWVSFAKAHHPELYLKLLDKVKDSGYMKYVDNHPLYSSLEKSGQATRLDSEEEALVTAIGQYGADFFQGNALIDFKRKMSSLFHSLAFDLGIPYKTNNKEIQDLSLKEVATQIADNMVSNDITYKGDRDKIDRQGAHNMDVLNKTPKGSVVYSRSIDLSNVPKAMVVHNTNAMGKYDPILEYEETKSTLDNDSSVKSLLDDYLSKRVAEDKAPEISTILSQPVFQNAGITEEYINNRYEEFKKASPVHAYLGLSEVLGIPTKAKDFVATHQRGSSVNNVNPKAQAVVSSKNDISERANNTTGTKNKFYKVVETIYDSIKKSAHALHIHDSIDSFIRAFDMNGLHPTKALTSNVMYRNGIMHIMDNEGLNQKHSDEVLHKALIAEVSKTPTKFGTILSAIASDPDNFEKYFKDSGFKTQADFTEFLKDVSPSDIKVLLSNPSTLQAFKDLNNLSDETKYEVGKAIHELADQKLGLILDPLSTHLDNMESLSAELSNVAEKAPHIPINQSYELELEEDPTVPQIKAMAGKSTKINKGSEKMDEISTYMAKYPDIPKSYWENILVGMEHEGEPVFTGNAITELVSKANVNSRGNKKSKTSNYSKRTLKLLQEDEQLNNMITSHFNKVMVGQTLTRKHFDEFFLQPTDEDGNKVPIERSEKNRIASITLTGQVQEMLDHDYHSVGQAMETVNLFNNKRHISHSQIIGVGYALNAVKESVDEFRAQIASESHTYTKSGMAGANARMDALVELQGHLFDAFTDMKRLAGQSLVIFQTNIMKSRAEISQEKLDRKLSKVTDEMRNKYPNFEAQIIESHKEMERMEEDIINLRAIDAGSVESQANEGFISAFNNAKQGAKFFDDTAKYDAEVSELIDKLNAIIGGDPSGKVKAQAGYEPAMIIKAMAGGFEADRELNHKSAVIFTLGKLLLQNKRLNINTLEELMDEIKRRKGGNINESEIRVAFALSTPKARTNTIDALKAKVTNVKNQAKLISNLGKLLEGFIMDKTQVTIDVNGVPTTFNSRILNAETQIPVWGIDVMDPSTGAMSFVEATDAQREEIKAEVEKVGIAVEKNGVSKSFIRVIDPANHDRSIWMSKDSNGQMIEASADERELIKKKVKANTSTSNIRGINLTKSVVINSPHSVSGKSENRVFSINNEGRWITLEKIARSESTWRYASDIEELEIHDQLNKVGPFTEIQNTLSNILKCATGLDNIMSNKEIAEFVSAVSDIQHLLPSSLSGITVDDFTIRQMLAKVDAMKALAKVDNIQSQIDAINQKLDIIKEGTDLNAITEMLRKASVPRNTYKSAELRKAEIRLRDAKKRYDSEIQGRLNNRRDALHTAGILMNTFKSLPASMDLSAMGIQGINMIKLGFLSGFGGLETAISKIPGATKFGSAIGIQSRRVRRMRSKMVREGAKVSLQSYGNIEVAENAYEQLRNHPDWPLMMAYGLPLTAPTEHGTDAEELFKEDGIDMLYQETKKHNNKIAKEAGKVLGLAKGLKDKSQASFTSYINSVRASLFLGYLDSYRATGVEPTSDELKRVAQYIGDVTMKSSTILGKDINKSLSALGYVLWAPKMYLANLKMLPNTLIRASQVGTTSLEIMKKKSQIANFDKLITALKTPVGSRTAEEQQLVDKKGNPSIGAITLAREGTKGSILDLQGKRRALKFATSQHLYSLASTVALNGLMYGLLKAICKDKPYWGTDATKSEFLKLGCGNSLRDYTGNTAGYIRMFMQVASKTYKKLGGYDMNGSSFYTLKDAKEVVQQFFVYKMNPALSTPVAVISNEDFMGNKLYDINQSSDIVAKDILSYSVGNILPLAIKDLFMSGSFLYNLNTFKDDGISPYIGAAGGAIGTVIGWNQKIPYSDDLPTLLKDRAGINPGWDDKKDNPKLDDIQGIMENPTKITMTPALEKLPINFEPLSADYMYFDKKKYGSAGDRNSDDYMYRLDKYMMSASFEPILYNLVKDRDNKKITEEVFKETVKSKLYTIKALTEQHLMNTGYEWGGNLLKATLILEVLKEKNLVPERIQEAMSGITKKGKKSKKSSTDILVSETMQKDLDEAAGYPTSIPESVVSRFTNSTKEQQAIQLEVEKRFKEKMKERGFVKYGAKPKFEKEINLYINPNITHYIGNSLR